MERELRKKLAGRAFSGVSAVRSKTMSAIRGKGNRTTEVRVRMGLVRMRLAGFILNAEELTGRPDFWFARARVAVFVDGCFWHGCPHCGHVPKTNSEFWGAKIRRNKWRDGRVDRDLRKRGISVVRIWECAIRDPKNLKRELARVARKVAENKMRD